MQCGVYVLMPLWHGKKLKDSYFTHIWEKYSSNEKERKIYMITYFLKIKSLHFSVISFHDLGFNSKSLLGFQLQFVFSYQLSKKEYIRESNTSVASDNEISWLLRSIVGTAKFFSLRSLEVEENTSRLD